MNIKVEDFVRKLLYDLRPTMNKNGVCIMSVDVFCGQISIEMQKGTSTAEVRIHSYDSMSEAAAKVFECISRLLMRESPVFKYPNPSPSRLVGIAMPSITNVIFNNPATIVEWSDGTKTVVKVHNEEFDKEKGLAMAYMKKSLATRISETNYHKLIKRWC